MIRRLPRSTLERPSAASDVYKSQDEVRAQRRLRAGIDETEGVGDGRIDHREPGPIEALSLIHISEPTRPY